MPRTAYVYDGRQCHRHLRRSGLALRRQDRRVHTGTRYQGDPTYSYDNLDRMTQILYGGAMTCTPTTVGASVAPMTPTANAPA